MDLWDKDAIDLVEPGFITFNGEGEMRSDAVRLARRVRHRGAVMAFPSPSSPGRASTRQISVLDGHTPADKGGLHGHIFFHNGDDLGFTCEPPMTSSTAC